MVELGGKEKIEDEPGAPCGAESKEVLKRQVSDKMGARQRDKELT